MMFIVDYVGGGGGGGGGRGSAKRVSVLIELLRCRSY